MRSKLNLITKILYTLKIESGISRTLRTTDFKPIQQLTNQGNLVRHFVHVFNWLYKPFHLFRNNLYVDTRPELIKEKEMPGIHNLSILNFDELGGAKEYEHYNGLADFSFNKLKKNYEGGNAIRFQTDEDFQENIECLTDAIGKLQEDETCLFPVTYRAWDRKVIIANSNGGHHFAAVYRQCYEQDRQCILPCIITREYLDEDACLTLLSECYPLLLHKDAVTDIKNILWHFDVPTDESLFSIRNTQERMIYISRKSPKSDAAYNTLVALGPDKVFDFSTYLKQQLEYQSTQTRLQSLLGVNA